MLTKQEKNIRIKAWIYTVLIHVLILFILFLIIIKTPIPPYPEGGGGGGLEVNFGYTDEGIGEEQPIPENQSIATNSRIKETSEDVITDETGEETNIEKQKLPEIDHPVVKPIKKIVEEIKKVQQEETKKEPQIDQKSLYPGKRKNTSEGTGEKQGDEGIETGSLYSRGHGQGEGTGTGNGSGSGMGDGIGNGIGNGIGDGIGDGTGKNKRNISFSLKGRKAKELPKPTYNVNEEGVVVVEIRVDKKGNVIMAEPGKKGTTTTNKALWEYAKRAALQSKFSPNNNPNDPEIQKGTITYNFMIIN